MGVRGFWDTMMAAKLNLCYGAPTGRLLVYDPATRSLEVLLDEVFFANGVALSPDGESFVLVCETYAARGRSVWVFACVCLCVRECVRECVCAYACGCACACACGV